MSRETIDDKRRPLERKLQQFDAAERDSSAIERQVRSGAAEGSRRWNAWSIIWLFIGLALVITVLFCGAAVGTKSASGLSDAAGRVRELANTLVLPIVTLVLGYSFGKRAE